MLADPRLVEADAIEMLDQVEVAPQRECRVFIYRMERREKNSSA
jgi:hypothetical protein